MASPLIVTLTQDNFEKEALQSKQPVLVDFWAEWCGPCKMLAPALDQIAEEQAGKAKVAKINVDKSPDLAAQFGIQGIPTLVYFANGQEQDRTVGALSK